MITPLSSKPEFMIDELAMFFKGLYAHHQKDKKKFNVGFSNKLRETLDTLIFKTLIKSPNIKNRRPKLLEIALKKVDRKHDSLLIEGYLDILDLIHLRINEGNTVISNLQEELATEVTLNYSAIEFSKYFLLPK